MASSVVILVLGTNLFWMFVLWLGIGHYAKTTRFLLEENRELARCTWATHTALADGSSAAGVLVNASAQAAGVNGTDPNPLTAAGYPMGPDDSRLMGLG